MLMIGNCSFDIHLFCVCVFESFILIQMLYPHGILHCCNINLSLMVFACNPLFFGKPSDADEKGSILLILITLFINSSSISRSFKKTLKALQHVYCTNFFYPLSIFIKEELTRNFFLTENSHKIL